MGRFWVWALVYLGAFAGLSMAYHLHLHETPRRVLFAVDSSYPMHSVWSDVRTTLEQWQRNRHYTVFSVVTDKGRVHGWQPQASLQQVQPYAPRNLALLLDAQRHAEYQQADSIVLITNAADAGELELPKRTVLVRLP
ncbi:hypothetical protein [Candidatus Entotheonella palauensis]|uniref:Uncharacterized protein n=1 Tax=Candidatus Entotheonella gemina TaxID=1429439 RepID=W4LV19_9BACT|nr:hypothetical protein [Candidatus Entotheonella palauensis]ETX01755.1 MAG: hypothetical protein ETSY2_36710 [Candidatus Entotheonella gemina]